MVDDTTPDETDDPGLAADRIEAALERIANQIERRAAAEPPSAELVARLDRLIERVRAALGRSAA